MNRMIRTFLAVASVILTFAMEFSSLAAGTFSSVWTQDAAGTWHAKNAAGQNIRNSWLCDDAVSANGKNVWYLLNQDGNMISEGLVQDGTGNYYSLETNHEGYYGMLRYQSGMYNCNGQQVYLDLEQSHNGSFAAIKNTEAIEKLKSIYGLKSVSDIDNGSLVYTSSVLGSGLKSVSGGAAAGGSGSYGSGSGSSGKSGTSSAKTTVYSTDSSNNYLTGNWNSLSADQKAAVDEVVADFKEKYITEDMSDFEKEMTIIQWICKNCTYGKGGSDDQTSYNCLVEHECVCAGYADAFLKMCTECGIECRYLLNKYHAWNLVKIGGKWSHVDVTWEDSKGSDKLRNKYINLSDSQIIGAEAPGSNWQKLCHENWSNTSIKGVENDYNGLIIQYYLATGIADKDLKMDTWRELITDGGVDSGVYLLNNVGYKFDDNSNYFPGKTPDEANFAEYLNSWFKKGHKIANVVFDQDADLSAITGTGSKQWFIENLYGNEMSISNANTFEQGGKTYKLVSYRVWQNKEFITDDNVKKTLEDAISESDGLVFTDAKEAEAYVRGCWEKHIEHIAAVYKNVETIDYFYWDYGEYKDCSRKRRTFWLDGDKYDICTFDCTYKTIEEYMKDYMKADGRNLFCDGVNREGVTFEDYIREVTYDKDCRQNDCINLVYIYKETGNDYPYDETVTNFVSESCGAFKINRYASGYYGMKRYDGEDYQIYHTNLQYIPSMEEYFEEIGAAETDENCVEALDENLEEFVDFLEERVLLEGKTAEKYEEISIPVIICSRDPEDGDRICRDFYNLALRTLQERLDFDEYRVRISELSSGKGKLQDGFLYESSPVRVRHEISPEEKTGE